MAKVSDQVRPRPPLRCRHCAGPLSKDTETSRWTVTPFLRDSFSMIIHVLLFLLHCMPQVFCMVKLSRPNSIGTAVGGTSSAFYGFNKAMPVVQRFVRGPMWVHFLVGSPPVIVFSSACAGLAGGAVPALAQLISSSCHAAVASSSLQRDSSRDDEMHKSRSSSPL